MSRFPLVALVVALCLAVAPRGAMAGHGHKSAKPTTPPINTVTHFPAAPHDDVIIEWWYVNTHLTTASGRHLAIVASFFRFGNGFSLTDGVTKQPRSHYLIYGITDLEKGIHQSFSYCDYNMMDSMRVLIPMMLAQNPKDMNALQMLTDLDQGRLPPPHQLLSGPANAAGDPLTLQFGKTDSLVEAANSDTDFLLTLGDQPNIKVSLNFHTDEPAMAVGGKGETGLVKPTDMYYYSLTNCTVSGSINTALGGDAVTKGLGWFDHQWGSSWGTQNDGWDWWGLQLDNGEQVLVYRQRDLATGKLFSPSATFMDAKGNQSATTNIVFTPDPTSVWTDSASKISYPLGWTVSFPDQKLSLHIQTPVQNQTIPTLSAGGGIWEGHVEASGTDQGNHVAGNGFMELVGYENLTTRRWVNSLSK